MSHETHINVAGVVVMSGSLRQAELGLTGRTLLDLPLSESGRVFDHWLNACKELRRSEAWSSVPLRFQLGQGSRVSRPVMRQAEKHDWVQIAHDERACRGMGGVLADLSRDHHEDAHILVIESSRLLEGPLEDAARTLMSIPGDARVLVDPDLNLSGMFLLRCGLLQRLPQQGFCDLKEQAFVEMAQWGEVRIAVSETPLTRRIRTRRQYLDAVRSLMRRALPKPAGLGSQNSTVRSVVISEPGAKIARTARISDSVILEGAQVDHRAVVVRSVVCPNARVKPYEHVIDRVLAA